MRPWWKRESKSIPMSNPSSQNKDAAPPSPVKMRPWWKRKSKSIPKSNPSSQKEEAAAGWEEGEGETTSKESLEKSNRRRGLSSEDRHLLSPRRSEDISSIGGGSTGRLEELSVGHPLPLPTANEHGAVSGSTSSCVSSLSPLTSASASSSASVSSSGSSDDASFLSFNRYSDTTPRGRNATFNSQKHLYVSEFGPVMEHPIDDESSPSKEILGLGPDVSPSGGVASSSRGHSAEIATGSRTTSSSPRSGVLPFSSSPRKQRALCLSPGSPNQWPDIVKSPPHPLPLPPGSPMSPGSPSSPFSSRSFKSRWKKGKLLGKGTFGHVYAGFNSETGQMCAIKEVKNISDDINSKESLKQLNQEIAMLSKLSHSNIVQYYGSELCDDTFSVYLEYVSGGSIHKLLQEYGAFSDPVIRNYTAKILSGLAYLHERNTIHRDIKGANILVGPGGEIKLADFGMAKLTANSNSIRSFKGSPYWMAPEVIMNDNGYSFSVDIWSLGCTVLEMASSKPPWSQFEGVAAIFRIANINDLPEIPDHLSSEGKDFIKLCLQRDPSARPSAFQLLKHPFVREQTLVNSGKTMMRRTRAMTAIQLTSTGNASPIHESEYGMRRTSYNVKGSSSFKHASGSICDRLNKSLPVSRCSSPSRQHRHSSLNPISLLEHLVQTKQSNEHLHNGRIPDS